MAKRPAGSFVLGVAFVGIVLSARAHAAPGVGPAPAPTPTVAPRIQGPVLSATKLDIDALPGVGKCGTPIKQKVTITNKTGNNWKGTVSFTATGGTTDLKVMLSILPGASQQTFELASSGSLDCTKPLGAFELRVTNDGAMAPIYSKAIKPMTVKAEQGFPAPPSNDLAPWLRRVTVNGTCGGTISGTAGLHTFSPQPKPAKVKLTLGAATKEETVQVQTTNTFVPIETTLDCSGAALPAFDYALLDGHPASGKLNAYEISFAP
jgi:hypothetical protein